MYREIALARLRQIVGQPVEAHVRGGPAHGLRRRIREPAADEGADIGDRRIDVVEGDLALPLDTEYIVHSVSERHHDERPVRELWRQPQGILTGFWRRRLVQGVDHDYDWGAVARDRGLKHLAEQLRAACLTRSSARCLQPVA